MIQRGRKGMAALTAPTANGATTRIERPDAPLDLTPEQSDVWHQIVGGLPADWFPRETWALLSQYCRHAIDARRLAQLIDQECSRPEMDAQNYGELLKLQRQETGALKSLATAMRLSQQAVRSDKGAATAKRGSRTVARPWESD